MTTRRFIFMGIVATIIWAAGCKSQPKTLQPAIPSSEQQPLDLRLQTDPNRKVDNMEAQAGSVDALARKAEAYSRELSPLLKARSASPAPQASAVEWMDPSEFRLGSQTSGLPADQPDRAAVLPVIQTGAANANQIAPAPPGETKRPDGDANTAVALVVPSPAQMQVRTVTAKSDVLAEKLSRRVKDYPRDVAAQLEYQLLQFLLDEPTPQLAVLSTLPTEDRELVTAVLDGLTNFRNALRADNNMLLSKKIKPVLDLAERLRSQADLTIPTISLCTRVNGFGSYDPIDPARFAAGKDHPAIVYCEVANFASNLNDKQLWETRLSWDMTLYTEQGMSVWSDKTETISDTSRNRRHDFFVRKMITLPGTLTIGRYLLKVSIVDTQSNRVAEATVPIVFAAQ